MSDMTLTEIEYILDEVISINGVRINNVKYYQKNNTINVDITSIWEDEDEGVEVDDAIQLTSFNLGGSFPFKGADILIYRKYLLAKGYLEYWKNNPYVEKEVF
jgi:hypothetical protein